MPTVSVIIPVYKVEEYVAETLESVLHQTYSDFEVVIVDDQSPDGSIDVCRRFQAQDPRIRIVSQLNRGLAGARNTGIRHAQGRYLAFLDSDDLWHPEKLERHVQHLDQSPRVGISFCPSAFIDEKSQPMGLFQTPQLRNITPDRVFCRNPIGNGSAPVIRREALEAIRFESDLYGSPEVFYFDDTYRQSEDIECWLRLALTTDWQIEGIPQALTYYRVNDGGLSANLIKQYQQWERIVEKARLIAPEFIARWEKVARAYQLRYLARRAVTQRDGQVALELWKQAVGIYPGILWQEPGKTFLTLGASLALQLFPESVYQHMRQQAIHLLGSPRKG